MAKHEFGITGSAPISGKRYDEYEDRGIGAYGNEEAEYI